MGNSAFPNLYNGDDLGLTKREYMATTILAGMVPIFELVMVGHIESGVADTAVSLADRLIESLARDKLPTAATSDGDENDARA